MAADKIEKVGGSLIQHGKLNDRVYIMKASGDHEKLLKEIESLCEENGYSKVFGKIPACASETYSKKGFECEAMIPGYFNSGEDLHFMSKFLDKDRKSRYEENDTTLEASNFNLEESRIRLPDEYTARSLKKEDLKSLAGLYSQVFQSYPFPITRKNFLEKAMGDGTLYVGVFEGEKIVSASSAEIDWENRAAELTDFATDPQHAGNNFAAYQIQFLEDVLRNEGFQTLYTIARAKSIPINRAFAKNGYEYSGTLVKNTHIAGNIEDMNVWHKKA